MVKLGVKAIILSPPDRVLLFHRDNIPTIFFPDCWHCVGGGIETGETSLEALRRELSEEATYVPKNLLYWGKVKGLMNNDVDIFVAFIKRIEEKRFKHHGDEGQGIGFFSLEEALKLKLTKNTRHFIEQGDFIRKMIKERKLPEDRVYGA
ncbi:MAG: NUDIX domain-containing protein [Candidatus Shapirobacteria bacterium]